MRIFFLPFLILSVTILAGCGQNPLKVVAPSSKAIHTVSARENVYVIAQKYFVSSRDIILANRLSPPFRLKAGQRLHIPSLRVHTVVTGETLGIIADEYRVSNYGLARLNRLESPFRIYAGQKLHIPSSHYQREVVQPKVRVAVQEKLQNNGQLFPNLPVVKAPVRRNKVTSQQVAVQSSSTKIQEPKVQIKQQSKQVQQASAGRYVWPLRGRVISKFGSKSLGIRNDGINISAKVGTAVKAIDHGTVVYAGKKLSGFGSILIIRHDNGFMSAYAHNQALLVKRGQAVQQGQVIARSGQSGNVTTGQLHFEIRNGRTPVDPLKYLRG